MNYHTTLTLLQMLMAWVWYAPSSCWMVTRWESADTENVAPRASTVSLLVFRAFSTAWYLK